MGITKTIVDHATYQGNGKRYVIWDTEVSGFGVRIYPSGKKVFVLSYRAEGLKRLMTLGAYGPLTVQQARSMALQKLASIISGGNPLQEKIQKRDRADVETLCQRFMDEYAMAHKKSWFKDKEKFDRFILPRWRKRKIETLTSTDVDELHREIGKGTPYQANRTLSLLHTMFEFALQKKMVASSWTNAAKGIRKFKEHKRDRYVTHEEMPLLLTRLNQQNNIYVRAAILLYILTGVRRTELLKAEWSDINWHRSELHLADTKAGRSHLVPLSTNAIEILRMLPKLEGNPYILPGKKTGHHLININKPWTSIRNQCGLSDVRLHDLRRTLGSWIADDGASLPLIGKILNHSNVATTAIYARLSQDPMRRVLETHGNKIRLLVASSYPQIVKPLELSLASSVAKCQL